MDNTMVNLILWNSNTNYPLVIQRNIMDSRIFSEENELKEYLNKKPVIESIIILAELNWNNKKQLNFYGFDIIQLLRLNYRLTVPILICSFMPESYFIRNDEPSYKGNILKAPAHQFLHLPFDFKNEEFKRQNKMDEDLLDDVNYAFFDIHGMAKEIIHALQNKLDDIDSRGKNQEQIFSELKPIIESSLEIAFIVI